VRSTLFVDASDFFLYLLGMTPEQCRAARGWLAWSQQELAERASVGLSTVRDFEAGRRQPIGNNLAAMERAFGESGVRFIFDDQGNATGIAASNASGTD
jgi:ribosome-binding protein aMBF1 (putative translation factor)